MNPLLVYFLPVTQRVQEAERSGVLSALMESEVREIGESSVHLEHRGR